MANVTIRNLPEGTFRRLKERAKRNRRSIAQEAAWLLDAALSEAVTPGEAWAEVQRVREMIQSRYGTFSDSTDDIRTDRER
jgi:plasmid stability protein